MSEILREAVATPPPGGGGIEFGAPQIAIGADPKASRFLGRFRRRFVDPLSVLAGGHWLPIVRRLELAAGRVALSYDDGPTVETTPTLIKLLAAHRATATFFLTGSRAALAPELVQELVAAGHDVFSHGWEHTRFEYRPSDEIIRDLDRTEEYLSRYRKTPSPYLVRLPYGGGHRSIRVHRAIAKWNPAAQIAHWTASTEDWSFPARCSDEKQLWLKCREAAMRITSISDLEGSILLLHEKPFDVQSEMNARVAEFMTKILLERLEYLNLKSIMITPLSLLPPIRRYVRPALCR